MCCCGCSLYSSTITAGIITILASLSAIIAHSVFLARMDVVYPYVSLDIDSPLGKLKNVFEFSTCPIDCNAITGLEATSVALNVIWLITAIFLLSGNSNKNRSLMRPWIVWTCLIVVYEIVVLSVLVHNSQDNIEDFIEKLRDYTAHPNSERDREAFMKAMNYIYQLLLYCRSVDPIWLGIVIALIIYVVRRGSEIEQEGKRPLLQTVISPYDVPQNGALQFSNNFPNAYGQPSGNWMQQHPTEMHRMDGAPKHNTEYYGFNNPATDHTDDPSNRPQKF